MRMICSILLAFCLMLPCTALGENAAALTPVSLAPEAQSQILNLYCGPTQGFYRHNEQTLDTGKPYVLFGQYDCWAMAAQGTPEAFGPVGWVEAGFITEIPYEPQLAFEDGFAAMIEETAQLTDNPLADNPFEGWDIALEPGTQVTVLAAYGDWIYIQAETGDTPVRAFVLASTIF